MVFGSMLGGYSHILLDALVHHDVAPFDPFVKGNPLYLDAYHAVLSIACAIVLTYYLTKWVESLRVAERWASVLKRDKT